MRSSGVRTSATVEPIKPLGVAGEYQLTLDTVLYDMIERCRELKLRAVGSDRQLRTDFTLLLTAKTVHSLYSPLRRQWIAL